MLQIYILFWLYQTFSNFSVPLSRLWDSGTDGTNGIVWTFTFLIHLCNTPSECCPFIKTFSYICRVRRYLSSDITYLWKCFSQVLFWKCGSFLDHKGGTEQHSLSYRYLWQVAFCVPVPHIYSSVGYCVVYLWSGSFHNLQQDKRKSAPHFLCIYMSSWSEMSSFW